PHSAPLGLAVYNAMQFPAEYKGDVFVAFHGSWNRATRTGYKIVRVRMKDGVPTGEYDDFVTGFVLPNGTVWGRPVGVTVAADGALVFSDDGSSTLWRVAYKGK
ncbi:MAG: PQQ-dependent sugar dehydrogenase, partial [Stellaceae bacterium]